MPLIHGNYRHKKNEPEEYFKSLIIGDFPVRIFCLRQAYAALSAGSLRNPHFELNQNTGYWADTDEQFSGELINSGYNSRQKSWKR